ncbi:erythromycin esterase family protein [Hymenobacter sp. BT664]|uniref:Erythromycin esterase family protein n=1 Tax=Hymenobacter montanus TaxID=2771359 RepID=A0A927BA86_9BACT|nr:erythromycin esterase family protein [Hymenobacter montanus]MBD2767015.1 erythromycin esterase family protein [Hymenobacter montanus]
MAIRTKTRLAVLVGLLALSACKKEQEGVAPSAETLTELNQVAIPIQGSSPSLPENDLATFDALLSRSKMVGLGEVSHGSKECFEMKHRLFAYGVKNHNYKAIGFETPYLRGYFINRYIQGQDIIFEGRRLEINEVLLNPWATQEVLALVNWMRNYNLNHPDKIYFFGFDIQYFTSNNYAVLENYLTRVNDAPNWSSTLATLKRYTSSLEYVAFEYHKLPESEKGAYRQAIQAAKTRLQQNKEAYVAASSQAEFNEMAFLLEVAQKAENYYASATEPTELQTSAEFIAVNNKRDKLMAESAEYYIQNILAGAKTMLWAHNSHVFNQNENSRYVRMGYHLRSKAENQYGIISFALTKGEIRAVANAGGYTPVQIANTTPSNSLNALFTKAVLKRFVLSTANAPTTLRSFLSNTTMFNTGAGYSPQYHSSTFDKVNLVEFTDAVIYFDTTQAAAGL